MTENNEKCDFCGKPNAKLKANCGNFCNEECCDKWLESAEKKLKGIIAENAKAKKLYVKIMITVWLIIAVQVISSILDSLGFIELPLVAILIFPVIVTIIIFSNSIYMYKRGRKRHSEFMLSDKVHQECQ